MAKRVILAVAGAGKTYRICHEMQPEQKNLIVAFTHANIKNIQNELLKEHGKIPDATRIMTFDAFVYHMIIRPYEKTIYNFFGQNYKFEKTSITLKKPPQQRIKINGRYVPNKSYKKKGNVIMSEGLVLQDVDVWYDSTKIHTTPHNNMTELYFEDNDIEGIIEKLESGKYVVSYVTELTELDVGQKLVRFYDPSGNLIEVRTPISYN